MKSAKIFLAVFFILSLITLWAAPSPWDSWRSGYTNFEQGESLRERGSYTDALKFFEKARKNYLAVRAARPDWNQRVIADRLRDCDRQISELRRLLGTSAVAEKKVRNEKNSVVSEKNDRQSERNTSVSDSTRSETAASKPVGNVQSAEYSKDYETMISALKRQIIEQKLSNQRLNSELQKQRKFEEEIASLLRDRKVVDDRYALLEKRYRSLEDELKRPNEKIALLEQQLLNEKLNNERIIKQFSGSEQQLKIEKENSRLNQIAKKALEELLKKRDDELLQKNHEVSSLMNKLKEIVQLNDQISELKRIAKLRDLEIKEFQKVERERTAEIEKLQKSERERAAEVEKLQKSERERTAEIERLQKSERERSAEIEKLQKSEKERIAEIEKLQKSERERIAENKIFGDAALKKIAESKDINEAALKKIAESESARELALKKLAESESARELALKKLAESESDREAVAKKLAESESARELALKKLADSENIREDVLKKFAANESASKRESALLQEEKKSLEVKIADLVKERDSLAVSVRTIQDKNNSLTSENRTLNLNWEQEKNAVRLNAAELSGLRERNRQLEDDLKLIYKKAEELEKRLATRNSADFQAAAAAKDSMKQMENNLLAAQNQLISLRSELDAVKKGNDERERKLKAVNDENLKARAEVIAASEKEKVLQQEISQLRPLKAQFEQLQKNFNALAAENRENRLLVEAAKPRQAELEKAKLRLVENDRLKNELAKEQQLNAELKSAYNKDQNELRSLRQRAGEFETARRKMVELEARAKEAERLQNVERELLVLRQRETELAELKIKFNELSNSLRKVSDDAGSGREKIAKLTAELDELRKKSSELEKLKRVNQELNAMLNTQNGELNKLNNHIAVLQKEQNVDTHSVCRMEAEKLRAAAASAAASAAAVAGPLRDQIQQLQSELSLLKQQKDNAVAKGNELSRKSILKDREIKELRRLNSELVEFRKKSANELLAKVDASKVARLEDELTAINKLNAELAAERDKLAAQLNNRNAGRNNNENGSSGEVMALQSDRSPEELAGAGLSAEKDGKPELAIWHYKQAVANNKDFAPAHFRLGMIYYRRGSFADAAQHLSIAHNADPENRQLALVTARCFIAVSRFGNAKTIIDPLLKSEPENARVLLCAALIDAGCGASARAEEKLLTAARIVPDSFEIQLELAKLLAASISDRREEAVIAYEKARELGAPPEPGVEKMLGSMLDHRRELVKFMSGAAREAEINSDWGSAVWYYKKIIAENHPGYIPLLAFAQWKSGNTSAARETLELNKPSRNAMVIRFLISYAEKDNEAAMRAAQQSVGAVIPADWVGVNLELEKLKKQSRPSAAVKVLLKSLGMKTQK
ncbi:MAG: tetratricopeptide repeat protein [Lentisphaeria bacterium]|nr:tetratricopeptide repeat protein [Lentisphaeria bacterium]